MISQHRDLRTGSPVWDEYRRPRMPHGVLTAHIETDILVIGGGISGAMMAEALSGQGLDIVVVDKRKPLTGSTSATTALLQYEIDEPLTKLSGKIGAANAAAAWRRSKLGLESLAVKIRELKLDCAFERRNSLYLSGNILDPDDLEEENKQRNAIGLQGQMLSRKQLMDQYGIRGGAGLLSWDNIACNPVQLAAGFFNKAIERGVQVFSPVEIMGLTHRKNDIEASTDAGFRIRARHVVFATGYEIPAYVKTRKHQVHSTWALSTKPVKGMPTDYPLMWEAGDPYCYARSTADGRLIFGGEDEEFSDPEKRDALIPRKQKILERKLKKIFPHFETETEHVWAGSFGGSTTGLPSLGRIPGKKNCYAVMAYGGNGITFSRIAAEIVSAQIMGYRDPDEKLFAFKS